MNLIVRSPSQGVELTLEQGDPPMVIGRDESSGVLFTNRLVSSRHARVFHDGSQWVFEDVGSTNGSFLDGTETRRIGVTGPVQVRLGDPTVGEIIELEPAAAAAPAALSPTVDADPEMTASRASLSAEPATTGAASSVFAVHDLTVETAGVRRLDRISFDLPLGAMLGVLGGSGAGKSTMVKAMTGADPATGGQVVFEGHDLYADFESLRRRIGYVPQDDILHTSLTVRATLQYGTALRMPGATPAEREQRASDVLEELGLSHRVDALVSELSGGQRKRLNVALELLARPPLLILDEPTSGLDPANERSLMQLLRQLADGGRTVIVVTHSTESLHLCDEVLVLARGGVPAYLGPAAGFAAAFGQTNLIDAFGFVDNHADPVALRAGFDAAHPPSGPPAVTQRTEPPPPADWKVRLTEASDVIGRDTVILLRRSLDIVRGDRRNAIFVAAQAPVIGVLLVLLFNGSVLDVASNDPAGASLLMAMVLAVVFIGSAGTVREIVKERPIMLREQAFGVSTEAYLASKLVLHGTILMVQAILIVVLTTLVNSGPNDALFGLGPVNELTLVIVLTGLVSAASGLAISAAVTTNDKAMTLLPVFLFVQLLLAGMIVPVHHLPMRIVSWFVASKWGLDGAASIADLTRMGPKCVQQPDDCSDNWLHEPSNLVLALVMLIVLLAGCVYLTWRALRRNDPALVLAERAGAA